jgi:hypothetical protein
MPDRPCALADNQTALGATRVADIFIFVEWSYKDISVPLGSYWNSSFKYYYNYYYFFLFLLLFFFFTIHVEMWISKTWSTIRQRRISSVQGLRPMRRFNPLPLVY